MQNPTKYVMYHLWCQYTFLHLYSWNFIHRSCPPWKLYCIFSKLLINAAGNFNSLYFPWAEVHQLQSPYPSKSKLFSSTYIQQPFGANNMSTLNQLSHLHVIHIHFSGDMPTCHCFGIGGIEMKKHFSLFETVVIFRFCYHILITKFITITSFSTFNYSTVCNCFFLGINTISLYHQIEW